MPSYIPPQGGFYGSCPPQGMRVAIPIVEQIIRTTDGKLYHDTFDGTLNDYIILNGAVTIEGAMLSIIIGGVNANKYARLKDSVLAIENMVVECDFIAQALGATKDAELSARDLTTKYYLLQVDGENIVVARSTDWAILGSYAFSIATATLYKFHFSTQSNVIKARFHDNSNWQIVCNTTDGTVSGNGTVRIQNYNANNHIHYDNLKVYKSSTMRMENLANGQKFRIRKSDLTIVATSGVASGGFATIDIYSLNDRPPYFDIQVLDTDGVTVVHTDTKYQNDIWGGDIYAYVK